jgi:hypothetical protein
MIKQMTDDIEKYRQACSQMNVTSADLRKDFN